MNTTVEYIAIVLNDGSVGVMQFVTASDGPPPFRRAATPANIAAEIARTTFPPGRTPVSWRVVPFSALPTDRYFRNAWTDTGAAVAVDMTKAREVHRAQIRKARAPLLRALDGEYLKALELADSAEQQRIADEKQALRDATQDPAIDAAKTPEELKAVWPLAVADAGAVR